MTPEDLAELIEDTEAAAAYHRTYDQESVPIAVVDRLIARENPVRVWREHRGHSLRGLAERVGMGIGYLSQIENGERKGTVQTLKKIAAALCHARIEHFEPLLALAAADDLDDPRRQHVHRPDGPAVIVDPHVEGLDVLWVVHHDDRLLRVLFREIALVLRLEVDAPF